MLAHNFAILDSTDMAQLDYRSIKTGERVSVKDEVILRLMPQFQIIRTYHHTYERPELGLAYYGITIIPPASLSAFLDVLLGEDMGVHDEEVNALMNLVWSAIQQHAAVLHFGI